MNDLRDWIEHQCIRYGFTLNQQYTVWSKSDMETLGKILTTKRRVSFPDAPVLETDTVMALIHRICLDNVRNTATKHRRREARKVS